MSNNPRKPIIKARTKKLDDSSSFSDQFSENIFDNENQGQPKEEKNTLNFYYYSDNDNNTNMILQRKTSRSDNNIDNADEKIPLIDESENEENLSDKYGDLDFNYEKTTKAFTLTKTEIENKVNKELEKKSRNDNLRKKILKKPVNRVKVVIEKREKILNFNITVGNQNNNVANEYLSLTNWNVSEAVNLYLGMNSNTNNLQINNNINLPIFNYITEYSFVKSGILDKFSSFIKLPFLKNNIECCKKFNGKVKNLVKTGEVFTNLLKTNKGVIILYNKDTFYKVFQHLDLINNDNQNNYLNSVVIYPIIDNSNEGKNLINNMRIIRFPCYLFCQYKSNDIFYIFDKMEGIFFLQTFKSTLFPQIINSNINNINTLFFYK